MKEPTFVTFTGVDRFTDRCGLIELAALEGVEIGILYTETPEGRNRYPTVPEIISIIDDLHEDMNPSIALHVCGKAARDNLFHRELIQEELIQCVDRIQVNGVVSPGELRIIAQVTDQIIITQHHSKNCDLVEVELENHELLVDVSGGRGILPTRWFRPDTEKNVGFAGGLSPDNIVTQWEAIKPHTKQLDWLDMETGIRTDDKFDVQKCFKVYELLTRI